MNQEVTDVQEKKNEMITKVEQALSKIYGENQKTEVLSLGCMPVGQTNTDSGIRHAVEMCFNNGVQYVKTLEKFKALGSWQKDNVIKFQNIALPFSFPDNSSVIVVGMAFLMKDKHFTTCIVVIHGTGLTSVYETNISLV